MSETNPRRPKPQRQRKPRRRKPKRQTRKVNWVAIVALSTVTIQVGGKVLQVWMEGRGGRL